MKLLSLFSGIGAFEKALDRLEINYKLVGYCEIDKYASKSYSAIHNVPETMNLGDITKVDEKALPKDIDLITYGFPCQDISLAGKQKGLFNEDGTQTRSGLFFEALRIIEETQPRVAIAENVKNLTSKKFETQFQIVLDSLEQAGYNNYWQVLNAKDYGIPQNRERVFIVSIRKDIDTGCFQFPEGFPLELRLKDMLEEVVDEKYYLNQKDIDVFKMFDLVSEDTSGCIQVGSLDRPTTHDFSNRVYSPNGIARTLMGSGGNQNDKAGQYLMSEPTINRIDIEQNIEVSDREYANTITTIQKDSLICEPSFVNGDICKTVRASGHGSVDRHSWDMVEHDLRIRKLTPKECFRLMDFDDEDFEKAEAVNSNTQLYKQAGNSIVVAVPEAIISALIDCSALVEEKEIKQMELIVNEVQIPEQIAFNYGELKQELTEKVSHYETLVYTDDQIKVAKEDRANLNKLKKALNDERIRREKEYMQPFNDFKNKINEIISIIDKPVAVIDSQVKAYEDKQKQEKADKIKGYFIGLALDENMVFLCFDQIWNPKWLNASTSMKSIQEEIDARVGQIKNDLATLSNLPEFGFEATEVYKSTLDINKALNEGRRLAEIARKKAEHEAEMKARAEEQARLAAEAEAKKQAEQVAEQTGEAVFNNAPDVSAQIPVVEKQWISFSALLSVEDATTLKEFFNSRNIEFKAV